MVTQVLLCGVLPPGLAANSTEEEDIKSNKHFLDKTIEISIVQLFSRLLLPLYMMYVWFV